MDRKRALATMCAFCIQKLSKRHIPQSVSMLSYILWGDNEQSEDGKAKNVKQTELLVDLRAAILKIGNYFQSVDPSNTHVVCIPLTGD